MKLQSGFRVFYLDDGTIGGSAEDIIHDLRIVEYEAGLTGLELNHVLFYYYISVNNIFIFINLFVFFKCFFNAYIK